MVDDSAEAPQRWAAKRRATLVLSILKGETSAQAAARKARADGDRGGGVTGPVPPRAENALRARPKDEDALKDEQIKKLKQKVGELVKEAIGSDAGRQFDACGAACVEGF
jgi:hypothetical protein